MDIRIIEPSTNFSQIIYQGSDSRCSTMTDVKWISEKRIIAAHRFAGKIYIIDLSGLEYNILTTYTHRHNNELYQTEAFELNKEKTRIYLICYTEFLFILDILPTNKIVCTKSIKLNSFNVPYHGVRIYDNHVYITPSAKSIGFETIKKMNIENYAITDIATSHDNIRIKHISFLENNSILLLINYKTDTTMNMKNHCSTGSLRLYSSDFQTVIDSYELPSAQLDSIVTTNYTFYATCRDLKSGFLLKGKVHNNKIIVEKRIPCEDFPHGIDILEDKIAYTSYSTSGIHFIDITE